MVFSNLIVMLVWLTLKYTKLHYISYITEVVPCAGQSDEQVKEPSQQHGQGEYSAFQCGTVIYCTVQ